MRAVTDPATIEQLLRRLAPTGAGVAASKVDASFLDELNSQERILVESARVARQSEFATGRSCAHRALAAIGADVDAIGQGSRRQPIWPDGVTGSISHAVGLAAAVATRVDSAVASLGLDVEEAEGVGPELWPQVLTPSESDSLSCVSAPSRCRDGDLQRQGGRVQGGVPAVERGGRVPRRPHADRRRCLASRDPDPRHVSRCPSGSRRRSGRFPCGRRLGDVTARLSRFAGADRSEGAFREARRRARRVARL